MSMTIGVLLVSGIAFGSVPDDSAQYESAIIEWASETVNDVKASVQRLQNLVEMADSPQVKELTGLYYENRHFLHLCKDSLGTNLASSYACLDLTVDIANITQQGLFGFRLATQLFGEVVTLLDETKHCEDESIWKRIGCYNDAFKDFQSAVKQYASAVKDFLQSLTTILKDFEMDIVSCFTKSQQVSLDDLRKEIDLCKLYVDN